MLEKVERGRAVERNELGETGRKKGREGTVTRHCRLCQFPVGLLKRSNQQT